VVRKYLTTPSAPERWLRNIFLDGAATPPLEEGNRSIPVAHSLLKATRAKARDYVRAPSRSNLDK
jgi:hypothetical protein